MERLPRVRPGAALTLLLAINTLNFFDRQVLAAVAEPIRREWNLSDAQLGILATAFTLLYAFIGLPLGHLADRWSRRWLLAAGMFFWSGMTALSGFAAGFWSLFAARLCVGAGEAVCAPAATSLLGDLYPADRRSRALGIFMLGLPLGLALSYAVSGSIAQTYGWRAAFFVAGVPGLLLAAVTAALLPEPPRGGAESVPVGDRRRPGSALRLLLGIPTLWWIILSGALHNFNMYALSYFLPAFLIRTHGLEVREAGFATAVLIGAAGGLGLFAGGHVADRLQRTRPNGRLALTTWCIFGSIPFQLLALSQPAPQAGRFLLWMLPAAVLLYVYYATVYASIHDVVEPALRGTAMAVYFCAMYVLGASLGPVGTGLLSDWLAARAAGGGPLTEQARALGLQQAMYLIPALGLALGLVLGAASRAVVRDRQKLETWMNQLRDASPGT